MSTAHELRLGFSSTTRGYASGGRGVRQVTVKAASHIPLPQVGKAAAKKEQKLQEPEQQAVAVGHVNGNELRLCFPNTVVAAAATTAAVMIEATDGSQMGRRNARRTMTACSWTSRHAGGAVGRDGPRGRPVTARGPGRAWAAWGSTCKVTADVTMHIRVQTSE